MTLLQKNIDPKCLSKEKVKMGIVKNLALAFGRLPNYQVSIDVMGLVIAFGWFYDSFEQ